MQVDSDSSSPAEFVAVSSTDAGTRLDAVAAAAWPMYSRSRLQTWIAAGQLTVDGAPAKAKQRLTGGEQLRLDPASEAQGAAEPTVDEQIVAAEPVALDILHEDESILVLNKPVGLVMHPAPGHRSGTVMNGLVHRDPALRAVPRAGIVHRLDRDTTGVCVVARTLTAQTSLVRQLQARTMGREYRAVVVGHTAESGTVTGAIGRHSQDRKRMAMTDGGKPAVTHFQVAARLPGATVLDVRLETGRTHQIRVHMTAQGHPLIGDPVYKDGRALALNFRKGTEPRALVDAFGRQALHAQRLHLTHPATGKEMSFESPVPEDIHTLCEQLARCEGQR